MAAGLLLKQLTALAKACSVHGKDPQWHGTDMVIMQECSTIAADADADTNSRGCAVAGLKAGDTGRGLGYAAMPTVTGLAKIFGRRQYHPLLACISARLCRRSAGVLSISLALRGMPCGATSHRMTLAALLLTLCQRHTQLVLLPPARSRASLRPGSINFQKICATSIRPV